MALPHDTVAILGLGLIGGSLAKALRRQGFCNRLIGCGHRSGSLERGVALGVIDEYTLDIDEAVAQADIVVLCAPTLKVAELLEQILPNIAADGPVITDVASVKGNLREAALRACGAVPRRLVLAHPIAGSERSGVDAASAELFEQHRVILTPEPDSDTGAVELIRAMWHATGAEVSEMSATEHDAVLAATSHLPHVLAYALVDALSGSGDSEAIFKFAAGGFRDFTRIASSDPVMWRDIALANREALLSSIDEFSRQLATLRAAIDAGQGEVLEATFSRAKTSRDHFAQLLAAREVGTENT